MAGQLGRDQLALLHAPAPGGEQALAVAGLQSGGVSREIFPHWRLECITRAPLLHLEMATDDQLPPLFLRALPAAGDQDRLGSARRSGREGGPPHAGPAEVRGPLRSEEHTSELQSRSDLVCRLLLEKKK